MGLRVGLENASRPALHIKHVHGENILLFWDSAQQAPENSYRNFNPLVLSQHYFCAKIVTIQEKNFKIISSEPQEESITN